MRTLLFLLTVICVSCSHDDDNVPAPVMKEQVVINWSAASQGKPLAGYVKLQVYSGDEYYEVQFTKKEFNIDLKKGDYGFLSINPTVTDQSQNEAGIVCNYTMFDSKGIIAQGTTQGTNFLIK